MGLSAGLSSLSVIEMRTVRAWTPSDRFITDSGCSVLAKAVAGCVTIPNQPHIHPTPSTVSVATPGLKSTGQNPTYSLTTSRQQRWQRPSSPTSSPASNSPSLLRRPHPIAEARAIHCVRPPPHSSRILRPLHRPLPPSTVEEPLSHRSRLIESSPVHFGLYDCIKGRLQRYLLEQVLGCCRPRHAPAPRDQPDGAGDVRLP